MKSYKTVVRLKFDMFASIKFGITESSLGFNRMHVFRAIYIVQD